MKDFFCRKKKSLDYPVWCLLQSSLGEEDKAATRQSFEDAVLKNRIFFRKPRKYSSKKLVLASSFHIRKILANS